MALSARTIDYIKVGIGDVTAANEIIAAATTPAALSFRTQYWVLSALARRSVALEFIAICAAHGPMTKGTARRVAIMLADQTASAELVAALSV